MHQQTCSKAELQVSDCILGILGQNICYLAQVAANYRRPPPLMQEKMLGLPTQTAPAYRRADRSSIASKLVRVLYQRKHVRHEKSSYRRHLRDDEESPSCNEEEECRLGLCWALLSLSLLTASSYVWRISGPTATGFPSPST